jgi:hypothetical protein
VRRKSESLGLEFEVRQDKGGNSWVKFEDGVLYTPDELPLLAGLSDEIMKSVHSAKKIMLGTIVKHNKEIMEQ